MASDPVANIRGGEPGVIASPAVYTLPPREIVDLISPRNNPPSLLLLHQLAGSPVEGGRVGVGEGVLGDVKARDRLHIILSASLATRFRGTWGDWRRGERKISHHVNDCKSQSPGDGKAAPVVVCVSLVPGAEVVEGVLEPESQIISPSDSLNGIHPSISSLTPFLIHTSIQLVSIQPLI